MPKNLGSAYFVSILLCWKIVYILNSLGRFLYAFIGRTTVRDSSWFCKGHSGNSYAMARGATASQP